MELHRLPERSSEKDWQKLRNALHFEEADLVTVVQAAKGDAASMLRKGIPVDLHMYSFHHVSPVGERE